MRLLVPGGAGFIGSMFVRVAVANGHQVSVVDALTYRGRRENIEDVEHEFVHADVCDIKLMEDLVSAHEAVVNFANGSFVDRSISNPGEFVHANVLGTAAVVEAVRRNGSTRLVHVSTDEVYGSIDPPGSFSTTHRLDPSSPYSATKAAGDLYALASHKTYGTPVVLARMCNIYGERQHPENFIPRFVTMLLQAESPGLYGDGLNVREWLWVGDACDGLMRVLEDGRHGEIYHLGSGEERTNLDVARQLADLCGKDPTEISFIDDRPGHDRRYRLDTSQTEKELGWKATSDFDEKLAETVAWYRNNQAWWQTSSS